MISSRTKWLAGIAGALAGLCLVLNVAILSADAQGRGSAHLTITRTASYLYVLAPAGVSVNGQDSTWIKNESSVTIAIPAGKTTISVSGLVHPGSSSVVINAKPGGRYAVEVFPREESFLPGAVFGLAGTIVDAAVNKNSGAFSIRVTRR